MSEPTVSVPANCNGGEQGDSIGKLIERAKQTPVTWIIEGLWQQGGIAVVHSLEEEFKSVCAYQMAEAVAGSSPFLRLWRVPIPRRIGVFQTEMDDLEVGKRLATMYPQNNWPTRLVVSDNELQNEFRKRRTFEDKMECVENWMKSQNLDLLAWDTINNILASAGDPNSEGAVSRFFDAAALLPHKGLLLVRHDSKPSQHSQGRGPNQRVRGSNRIVEDASLVIQLRRKDKAAHKVEMEVGKLRNGPKPEKSMELWFDAGTFRLTPLPPLAALLESGSLTREEVIEQANWRFRLKQRAMDEQISEMGPYLNASQEGHKHRIALNPSAALQPSVESASWQISDWWGLLKLTQQGPDQTEALRAVHGEMQGCNSTHQHPEGTAVARTRSDLLREAQRMLPGSRELEVIAEIHGAPITVNTTV